MKNKTFIMYSDWSEAISRLTDEQAGQVLKAMLAYHNGHETKCADPMADFYLNGILIPIFEKDQATYNKVCEKRRSAANAR